jgi:hypothetical protein
MLSLAIFGGSKIDGADLEPGERAVALALFGGVELDFSTTPAPFVDVVVVAVFGGVVVKVQPARAVRLAGFSLFGGRHVEARRPPLPSRGGDSEADDGSDELPLEIHAFALFGAVVVKRTAPPDVAAAAAL